MSDLPDAIHEALIQTCSEDPGSAALRVIENAAMTWYAQAVKKWGTADFPFTHTDDCMWHIDTCTCGLDGFQYDLIWALMYPVPRVQDQPSTEGATGEPG